MKRNGQQGEDNITFSFVFVGRCIYIRYDVWENLKAAEEE